MRTILRAAAEDTGRAALEAFDAAGAARAAQPRAAASKRVLLIIGGGIAAYKSLDLIRRLNERGVAVRCIMTKAGAAVRHAALGRRASPASASSPTCSIRRSEFDVGHIRLAREADLVVVAPATADLMAKMAGGHADDLATTVLLATKAEILLAPAMNPQMWAQHGDAAQSRAAHRRRRRAGRPERGRDGGAASAASAAWPSRWRSSPRSRRCSADTLAGRSRASACWSPPARRMSRSTRCATSPTAPPASRATPSPQPRRAPAPTVTLGHRPGQPARSARRQDRACRERARDARRGRAGLAGRRRGLRRRRRRLAGGRAPASRRLKKTPGAGAPPLALTENPDILSTVAHRKSGRPALVIGFAAETENVVANARAKLARKGCDWILANDVSPQTGIMGGDRNTIASGHRATASRPGRRRPRTTVARRADRAHRRRRWATA